MNSHSLKLFIALLSVAFLASCGDSGNKDDQSSSNTDTTQQNESKQPETGETTNNSITKTDKKSAEGYTLISYVTGGQKKLQVVHYKSGTNEQLSKKEIDLSKYSKGELAASRYNSTSAWEPVQCNAAMDKFYISLISANMLEGTFEWNKIIEYNTKDGSYKEIVSLDKPMYSWYYVESANKIIGLLEKQLVSIDLPSQKVEDIFTLDKVPGQTMYDLKENKLKIAAQADKNEVIELLVDINTNKVEKRKIGMMNQLSSVRNDQYVELYKEWKDGGAEEVRLHMDGTKKSIPFNFSNFSSYWINDDQFVLMTKNTLHLMDTQLKEVRKFEKANIHLIDCLESNLLIEYGENTSNKKVALLDFDFKNLIDLKGLGSSLLVIAKSGEK
ncbi:MAG TPA: hypothetical protein DCS93_25770 [Microscillaceae bacterium]|nr:hypothetical protein [Microscillaceae bacterium]